MEPNEKDINEFRSSFLKKCEEEKLLGTFHQNDVNRAKNDNDWLRRFLLHHDNDQKEALNMIIETCEWRKKFGTNDITEKSLNLELLECGSIFSHGKDRDGKALLIFKSKKHVKGAHNFDDLKRHLVYWMERMERQEKGEMISIFFDMDGAGLSNMDSDYTKYIISLFKNYYPYFLNYIIIFEMAWVLNAAFKLIKTWLPPKAAKKIKFVNKLNLKELVEPEQALKSWGGLCDYVYVFKSDERSGEQTPVQEDCKKKVHFADKSLEQDHFNESGFIEPTCGSSTNNLKLTISPTEFLPFSYEGHDLTGSILLKNDDVHCLTYKIKATSPKKFRVRPSVGILSPDKTAVITVILQTGYELPGLNKDRFLIMILPVESPDITPENLLNLWKNASEEEVNRYKLRCTLSQTVKTDGTFVNGSAFTIPSSEDQKLTKVNSDIIKIQATISGLRDDVKIIKRQQWIIAGAILLLTFLIAYISKNNNGSYGSERSCWLMNATEQQQQQQ